jgi:hypothetical protein
LNIDNDSVKQAQIAIENLTKEINTQEISLTQRHRDLEQESKKVFENFCNEKNQTNKMILFRKLKNFNQLNVNGNQ